ncbi:MAG: FtsX-like permease family protein, partial [Phaeodactylibacter sp.]|nr:FtsX-like permease family protein [Phaeodactylibacter sp.]
FLPQPLTDIHLTSHYQREMRPNGSLLYVRIFALAGLFILLIACVNYINLYTAQSFRRSKEVGVRKVMGAGRRQLARQFLFEAAFAALLATVLALAMVEGLRYAVNTFVGIAPFAEPFAPGELALTGAALFVVVALLSGAYPAFYLSYFNPAEVLKGKKSIGLRDVGVRNALVAGQFVLSIGLLAGTLVVRQQLSFFQHKKLGFDKENVLVIENDREIDERAEEFKEELRRHAGILNASFSNSIPGLPSYQMRDFRVEGSENSFGMNWYQVDDDHLATLGMKLKEGRGFDSEIASDSFAVLLNEAAVRHLGLENPIGKYLVKNAGENDEERLKVIGVLEDFHLESLHQPVAPLAVQYFKGFVFKDYISVRLAAGNPQAAIDHVEEAWKRFEPGVPLRYYFLDADYDSLYRSERLLGKAFALFSLLALFIAGLGLFGLAAYVAEQRTKEIGIRKVLGATVANIVQLLSGDFLKLVGIAFIIAAPLAWWGMNRWLQGFAYRMELEWWVFVLAGGIAAAIALLAVGVQALKAALGNPVEALRYE